MAYLQLPDVSLSFPNDLQISLCDPRLHGLSLGLTPLIFPEQHPIRSHFELKEFQEG